jgi:hypothetical protein
MTKFKIAIISFVTLLIIGGIIFGINALFPRTDSSQNSSSSSSQSSFNLQNQVQSVTDQIQAGIVEDSLKSTPRLNLSSISNSDLDKFVIKSFSDGSKFLKVDKAYYYNDKFYELLNNPVLLYEGRPYEVNKDNAYFFLTKEFKLIFLDYSVSFAEEFKINDRDFIVMVKTDLFGGYSISITTTDILTVRDYEEVPEGIFREASKTSDNKLSLTLANGNGRDPEIRTVNLDLQPFVTRFFVAKSSSSTSATPVITFGN